VDLKIRERIRQGMSTSATSLELGEGVNYGAERGHLKLGTEEAYESWWDNNTGRRFRHLRGEEWVGKVLM